MNKPIDVETYARERPHFEDGVIPPLLERYLRQRPLGTVVDAGCGDGSLVRAIARGGFGQERLLACDASATRIERVGRSSPIEAFVDDIETLAHVEDATVDFFVSSQVIEHVDDRKMLATVARVTKPGARVFLSTVQKRWYGWYFYRSPAGWALDPTHLREYRSDDELLGKIAQHPFVILDNVKTPIAWPIADFFVKRLSDRNAYARSRALRLLRSLKVPVVGYLNWELVLERVVA